MRLLILFLLLISKFSYSQIVDIELVDPIEVQPYFQHGNDSLYNFIYKTIRIPKEYNRNLWESNGRVFVSFYIEKNGRVTHPKVMRSMPNFPKLDEEVIKAIRKMPNWKPGEQSGKPVRVRYTLPIRFSYCVVK